VALCQTNCGEDVAANEEQVFGLLERAAAGAPVTISVRGEEGAVAFDVVAECDVDAERSPLRDRVEALGGRVTIRPRSGRQISVAGSLPLSR